MLGSGVRGSLVRDSYRSPVLPDCGLLLQYAVPCAITAKERREIYASFL